MDINLLVVNVGNSRLSVAAFVAGELAHVSRVGNDQRDRWRDAISETWTKIEGRENPEAVGATVNPQASEPLEHAVEQVTGKRVQWVGRDVELPIKVLTQTPAETGVDRVLNIAAAYEQMGKACVVVDAGSAITVDCCNDKGEFLGGAIAPGTGMMLDALHERTAKLPRVTLAAPDAVLGNTTEQAIRQGVFNAARGLVKELVENYATSLGFWPDIIATGGDAEILFGGWELIHAISPDLTLYGIALAYANHHIKHGT